jgi:hypothetical protein
MNESDFALAVWRNAMQVLPRWSVLCADKGLLSEVG